MANCFVRKSELRAEGSRGVGKVPTSLTRSQRVESVSQDPDRCGDGD